MKVKLAGEEYPVRPLSVAAVFRLARVINKVFNVMTPQEFVKMDDKAAGIVAITQGLPEAEDDICAILADTLETDIDTVRRFPATGMIRVIRLMLEQEDLDELFFELSALAEKTALKTEEAPSPE